MEKNFSVINNNFKESQIQSIFVGSSVKAKKIHNTLLNDSNHYVQYLNYPTTCKGGEILRICLKHFHTKKMILDLLGKIHILLKFLSKDLKKVSNDTPNTPKLLNDVI